MKRKKKAELQAELDAANKRCADLADALLKALQSQPIYVPYIVFNPQPNPIPQFPLNPMPPYVSPTVAPFSEPWVITTCSNTDKVQS